MNSWPKLFGLGKCKNRKFEATRVCGVLKILNMLWGTNIGLGKNCKSARGGCCFDQEVLPLSVQFARENAYSRDVSAGTSERGYNSFADHVFSRSDQRYCLCCRFQRTRIPRLDCVWRGVDQCCRSFGNLIFGYVVTQGDNCKIFTLNEAIE